MAHDAPAASRPRRFLFRCRHECAGTAPSAYPLRQILGSRSCEKQPFDRTPKTLRDRLTVLMPAVLHHLAAARPDAIHRRAAGAKNPAVEDRITGAPSQPDILRIQTDDVPQRALADPRLGQA